MKKSTWALAMATAALLVGCGGGGSSSGTAAPATTEGHLVDSGVKGALYVCGTQRGLTDESGLFVCDANATSVTFYIGKLLLGWTAWPTPDGNVWPQDLAGTDRNDLDNADVKKIARFLQSIDHDGNPNNGINIDENMRNRFDTGIRFDQYSLDALISQAGVTSVDITSALEHLRLQFSGAASSSVSSQGSSSSASGSSQNAVDSADLAGKTVIAEYQSGTKIMNVEKISYIFLPGGKAIVVIDKFDGSRYVARDDHYFQSDGNNVALLNAVYDQGKSLSAFALGIGTENSYDKITVGHSTAYPYTVTAIVSNDDNGIDESTVHPITADGGSSSSSSGGNGGSDAVLNGKTISIFNHAQGSRTDEGGNFANNGYQRYDSNHPLHCTDYGYSSSDITIDNTQNGIHTVVYGFMKCTETDWTNSQYSGSDFVAWYK